MLELLFKQAVTQVGEGIFGTCTVCILTVNLHTCAAQVTNLGDSRFVYLRRDDSDGKAWDVVEQTKDQTCGFNMPFQIGKYPPGFDISREFTSEDADVYDMQHVKKNDLFVLATDGVFDNVFVKEMVAICDKVSSTQIEDKQEFVSQLAKQIGTYSLQCAKKTNGNTPFAQYAKVNHRDFTGGKMDDISVVVSLVC